MILIADDNEDDAVAIVETLKSAGIRNQLRLVGDGREVIAYLKGHEHYGDRKKHPLPSVLLLDLKMPRLGGFEVLEWLRFSMPAKDILIIILSGHGELGDIKRGYELGARSFLIKPCHAEDIRNLVRAYSTYWELEGAPKPSSTGATRDDLLR